MLVEQARNKAGESHPADAKPPQGEPGKPAGAPREDPRVVRTRKLLVQGFMDLLKEKSFQSITIQDIANRATVNRVTFYAHFADKYALLEYTIREMIRQWLRQQVPENTPFSPENLARLVLAVCEFLAEMERVCPPPHAHMQPLMEKQIRAELHEILVGWLAERPAGGSSRHPTPEQAAMVASWALYGAALQWIQQGRPEPAREYVEQMLPLLLGSLQPLVELAPP